jgi:predicted enzyme related to lactoylglutathione lyase
MSDAQKHAPGNFCWIEVGTTDHGTAKKFYTQLFDWEADDVPAGPMTYTLLKKNGREIGGLYELTPEMKSQGTPSHWLSYVAVDNADVAAKKAATLGGRVVVDAMDVMEHGRMAVLQDPTGATFAVWQAKQHGGAQVVNEPGSVCWTELATRDRGAAAKFYSNLFAWQGDEQQYGEMPYTMWMNGEAPVGGMMQMDEQWGDAPSHWMPYVQVDDCDAAAAKAAKLGGSVCVPPTDIPTIGRFAVIQDPTGGTFSVIKLAEMQA